MMVCALVWGLVMGGGPVHAGEIRNEVSRKGVPTVRALTGALEVRRLPSREGPSLHLTPGQWYRYHSITNNNVQYYEEVMDAWIAQRVSVTLNTGESLPIYVDSMELYFVVSSWTTTDTAYIWEDNGGEPGTLLHTIPFVVPGIVGRVVVHLILDFPDPLVVNTPVFWIGTRNMPIDTVFLASETCPSTPPCANPATVNLLSYDPAVLGWLTAIRDWAIAAHARKAHPVDEGVWRIRFPNWPFVVGQMDGDTVEVIYRNWGGNSVNAMGGRLLVTFRGVTDTFLTSLTSGPYPSTVSDTFRMSMASYTNQGVSDIIEFVAWSQQPGDQDLSNDTLRFTAYVFPNHTQWAQGWEFSTTGWTSYDRDGNGSSWTVYTGGDVHTGHRVIGDTARAGEDNVLVGPAWALGGTPGDATYGNVLAQFVQVPAGASVTLRVMALDGPDPATATVLWQKDHGLTGLVKAAWVQVQDTLPPSLNGSTVYPAWQILSTSNTPALVLLDDLYGRAASLALEVDEAPVAHERVRVVWRMPGVVEVGARAPVVLEVYGVAGRRVRVWRLLPGVHRVGLKGLAPGVYTLRVREEGRQRSQSLRVVIP